MAILLTACGSRRSRPIDDPWAEPDASAHAPLASYRHASIRQLGEEPLWIARVPSGAIETRVWYYGPFGGMTLLRLREDGTRLRGEATAFDERVDTVSSPRRLTVPRALWTALRDSLAAIPQAQLAGVVGGGNDGGWLIVEQRRDAQYASYACWAPYRAVAESARTPAKVLMPVVHRVLASLSAAAP